MGVVETTVLNEDVPHILSVNLLNFLGCVLDLPRNLLISQYLSQDIPVTKLGSGHRMADIVRETRGSHEAPESALQ
eukprot:8700519-Pyramimonas_sp.AAC.1